MIWGLLPVLLASLDFRPGQVGLTVRFFQQFGEPFNFSRGKWPTYPPKKKPLFWGILLQGIAILLLPIARKYPLRIAVSVSLVIGTAIAFPAFLAAIADAIHPGSTVGKKGALRLWRDLGYAVNAIGLGITAAYLALYLPYWH